MARNATKNDELLKKSSRKRIIGWLASYLKPYKLKAVIVICLMLVVMVCNLINPYFLKIAIDKYIEQGNIKALVVIAAVMICANLISMMASRKRIIMMAEVTNNILVKIRHELYCHIQKLSFSFFDNRPVGKILARVIGDVNALQELFTNSVTSFIPEIMTLICVTAVMFTMNYRLAVAAVIVVPILAISMYFVEIKSRKRWMAYRQKRSNVNAYTHEDFSGIRVVQAFAEEEKTQKTFNEMVKEMTDAFVSAVRLNDLFWPMVDLSSGIGTIALYWFSVRLIGIGELEIGTLVAFTMYIGMFWRPLTNIAGFYNTLITNFAAAERICDILDVKPQVFDTDEAAKMPKIKGSIEFKDVTFGYEDGTIVLDNVSFRVRPGETVALVGETGAGKTTIVNLISRFYDPNSGKVLIDDRDIKESELESVRSQMGIMLQDTFLFSTTIMENIRYGRLDATDEEVMAAAKAVSAHEFIMGLEDGYNTEVNERGSRLSVGQRQLISFARALLANPRILILDEATSNIDTTTEMLVQNGIKRLLAGRTSFVIAHRLSTIRDCDRIMVVDEGKIKECGDHKQLMDRRGIYYDLYMSQYKFLNEGA
jgi:ATP-binding cassette subfamily B protein